MRLSVVKIDPATWPKISKAAHRAVFGEAMPNGFERVHYALVCQDDRGIPQAYVTARENDHESVYWQFGGAFPPAQGSATAYRAFCEVIEWTRRVGMKRVGFLVENTNTAMLRFAMKAGFRVIGVRYFNGSILLEHALELR